MIGPERHARVGELLVDALERPADERSRFLGEACCGDELLRHEVESLIDAHEAAGDFLEIPILHAVPDGVVPAAYTCAMCGWFISARAWRSDSKRATTSSLSIPRLTSLIATVFSNAWSARAARYTMPIPPRPMTPSMR